jgi:transcription antitermination factor NusG
MAMLIEAKPTGRGSAALAPLLDRWHVLHTRPRQEKAVAEVLDAAGVRFYLPCVRRTTVSGGRRRVSELPLFASYLFLHGPLESVYFAVSTRRVVRAIEVPDQQRLARELDHVRTAIESGAALERHAGLRPGTRVRVARGPLRGVEGTVEEPARRGRLVLHVRTLAQGASLEIDPSVLEVIDDDA